MLLLGIVLGLAAAVLMPRLWQSLLPQGWKAAPVEGVVESKRWDDERLLLTLVTADGAVLATFHRQVPEIDLLVAPGDTVSLALGGYRPFVEDPQIARVVKAPPETEAPPPTVQPDEALPTQVEEAPPAPAAVDPGNAEKID